jgi:tetratricopeptide (TPR) repeat protein
VMATKAGIYQAQGNMQEAGRVLSEINEQTPSGNVLCDQLRLERNYGEATRLLQARLAQFQYGSKYDKSTDQVTLALTQRLAGDMVGAKVTAEQARDTLAQLYRDLPEDPFITILLSEAYAVIEEKDPALNLAQRAIMLLSRPKDAVHEAAVAENLAFIWMMFGENSRAISILTQLLQTPGNSYRYNPAPITRAFLRLDPLWDPLRADPAFQKLCEEKQP